MEGDIYGVDLSLKVEALAEETGLGADLLIGKKGDVLTVSGRENLGQALMHRLLTRRGELAGLGHPEYGSLLYQMIGEPNNERTRDLIRLYTKECVRQEPRVKEIANIAVRPYSTSVMMLEITVIPIESSVPMNLVFPFYLEVG